MAKKIAIPKSKAKTAYGLLNEVKKLILEEPRRYNQEVWRIESSKLIPACGTICCVAGWVETLKFKKVTPPGSFGFTSNVVFKRAQRKLGLTMEQARELFSSGAADDINPNAEIGTPEYAAAGAQHITRFQEKHAKQLKAKRV